MKRLLLPFVLFAAGCAPEIGDACDTSTDCSQNGDRLCDVSQEGGYCTVFDCDKGTCPEEATCVIFGASPSTIDACVNQSGTSPSQRSFCMLTCEDDSDCREAEGYRCLSPREAGGEGVDRDEGEGERKVCLHTPVPALPAKDANGDVCSATPDDGAAGAASD